ncbi:MAG: tripartite tricarboxylate transporter substrate binding protein [Betaproteobacteria bacterium]|nr:MAG: tripartite tricarboxylate transporter substrate binding protein [Betaproteobacteria bacterium]
MSRWLSLMVALLVTQAAAQTFPSKPIKIIVPYPAGGSTDQMARMIAPRLSAALGQPVIIENNGGGATMIGTGQAARAPADGYTLLATANVFAVNTLLHKSPSYKVEDFIPVAGIASYPYVLTVHPSVPAKNVAELIDYAKRQPDKVNAVSLGPGGVTHLLNERFEALAGVKITDIHYRGSAPAITDILSGQVQMYFDTVVTAMPQIRAGKLRALAVSTEERSPLLPDVPTFKEIGFPGMTQRGWFGIFAPAATPRPIVERLNKEVLAASAAEEARARFERDGLTRMTFTPGEFDAFIKNDLVPWERALKALNIHIE